MNIVHQWDERVTGRVGVADSISENGSALRNQRWAIVLPVKGIEIRVYDLEKLDGDLRGRKRLTHVVTKVAQLIETSGPAREEGRAHVTVSGKLYWPAGNADL